MILFTVVMKHTLMSLYYKDLIGLFMYSLCKVKTLAVFHISVPVLAPKHHKAFNYQVHTDLYF